MIDESVLQTRLVDVVQEPAQEAAPADAAQAPAADATPQAALTFEQQFKERLGLDFDAAKERLSKTDTEFHPLAKGVNQLLAEGKNAKDIEKYLYVQQLDIEKLTNEQVVKEQLAAKNPTLSQAHINALYDNEYGIHRNDDDTALLLKEAKLQQVAEQARIELGERKVQMQPTAVKNEADNALRSVTLAAWQPVAPTILNSLATLPISLKTDGGELSLDFVPNLTPEESNFVQQQLLSYASNNNLPITQDTTTQLRGLASTMVRSLRFEQILTAAVKDVEAAYKELSVRQIANNRPIQNGSGVQPPQEAAKIQRPNGMV
jgi:hypothetical protein